MVRQALQSWLDRIFPHAKIEAEYSLIGQAHIRFELGDDKENGTLERVQQATERALAIFSDTFSDTFSDNSRDIFVLIYEYPGENFFHASNEYLHAQFPADRFAEFYDQWESVHSGYGTTDESGGDADEKDEVRIIIGKLPVKDIQIANILRAIANTEMGFDPGIDQRVFFFDPSANRGFHMYDDRGCLVWSNNAGNIREIYLKRNNWIVASHKPEIDALFTA